MWTYRSTSTKMPSSHGSTKPQLSLQKRRSQELIVEAATAQNTLMLDESKEPAVDPDDDAYPMSPTAELLKVHHQMAHLPFSKLRRMAANGYLPKRLLTCKVPRCSSCMFGRATRRAWRSKTPTNQIGSRIATEPGQCVSVDQLESPTPGLIAQLKGIPTTQRYNAATVFVDHFSRLSYVHLQRSLSSEDTVRAKQAFERYCEFTRCESTAIPC